MNLSSLCNKKVDNYSMMIVGKYLKTKDDYINVLAVNSRFKNLTEMYLFNPIPISSFKLFPNIETLFIYDEGGVNEYLMKEVENVMIYYKISYNQYLGFKRFYSRISFKNISYTEDDSFKFGKKLKDCVNSLESDSLEYFNEESVNITSSLRSIGINSLGKCRKLKEINLPSSILSLQNDCLSNMSCLTSVTFCALINEIPPYCFYKCIALQKVIFIPTFQTFSITSFGESCFESCIKLSSVDIPTTLTSIKKKSFCNCKNLHSLKVPKNVVIDSSSFLNTNCLLLN